MHLLLIWIDRFFSSIYNKVFSASKYYAIELKHFRIAILIVSLYRLIQLWFSRDWLFYDGAWKTDSLRSVSDFVGYSLLMQGNEFLVPWFFAGCLFLIILLFFTKTPSILFYGLWVLYFTINQAAHLTISAGTQLTLFTFLVLGFEQKKEQINAQLINKLVWFGLRVLVCYLYFVAGFSKLLGLLWPNGQALEYVIGIEAFSLPYTQFLSGNTWMLEFSTLAVLVYQLIFPIAVWTSKIKYPLALVGILFHIGVFLINGIVEFSLVMLAAYSLFVPFNKHLFLLAFKYSLGAKKRTYGS